MGEIRFYSMTYIIISNNSIDKVVFRGVLK